LVTLVVALLGVGVLAAPALDLRLGVPDQGTYPEETTQRQAYDAIAEGFGPGFNGPLLVTVDLADVSEREQVLSDLHTELSGTKGVASAAPPETNAAGDAAILAVIPESGPDSPETEELVERLRADVGDDDRGARVAVTGSAALLIDFSERMGDALWTYLLVVIGLSFVLLLAVFRSVLVPLKATAGFLLSLGA